MQTSASTQSSRPSRFVAWISSAVLGAALAFALFLLLLAPLLGPGFLVISGAAVGVLGLAFLVCTIRALVVTLKARPVRAAPDPALPTAVLRRSTR